MAGGFHSTKPFHHRVALVASVTSKLPSALKMFLHYSILFIALKNELKMFSIAVRSVSVINKGTIRFIVSNILERRKMTFKMHLNLLLHDIIFNLWSKI